jgi:hypothetical protein
VIATEGATKHGASVIRNGTARGLRLPRARSTRHANWAKHKQQGDSGTGENTLIEKNKKNKMVIEQQVSSAPWQCVHARWMGGWVVRTDERATVESGQPRLMRPGCGAALVSVPASRPLAAVNSLAFSCLATQQST